MWIINLNLRNIIEEIIKSSHGSLTFVNCSYFVNFIYFTIHHFPYLSQLNSTKILPTLGYCSLRSNKEAPLSCLISSEWKEKKIYTFSFWFFNVSTNLSQYEISFKIFLSSWKNDEEDRKLLLVLKSLGKLCYSFRHVFFLNFCLRGKIFFLKLQR